MGRSPRLQATSHATVQDSIQRVAKQGQSTIFTSQPNLIYYSSVSYTRKKACTYKSPKTLQTSKYLNIRLTSVVDIPNCQDDKDFNMDNICPRHRSSSVFLFEGFETSAAVEIFKRMEEQGEKPTIISYGASLRALEKGKLYDEALQVWKHMINVGAEPNLYAYTIMASIYGIQGKFDIVDSIIREMVTVGIEPTVVTFNAIISACARNILGSVKCQNITPNKVTYEMWIEALAYDGKPRLAYELHLRAHNVGLMLSNKAYDATIQSSQSYGATIDVVSSLGPRPTRKKGESADQEKVVRVL